MTSGIELSNRKYGISETKSEGNFVRAAVEYSGEGGGIFKFFKFTEKSASLAQKIPNLSPDRVESLSSVKKTFATGAKIMIITKLLGFSIKEFFDHLSNWYASWNTKSTDRTLLEKFAYSVVELTVDTAIFLNLFKLPQAAKWFFWKNFKLFITSKDNMGYCKSEKGL